MKNLIRRFIPKRHSLSRSSLSQSDSSEIAHPRRNTHKSTPLFRHFSKGKVFLFIFGIALMSGLMAVKSFFQVHHVVVVGADQIDGIEAFENHFLPLVSEKELASSLKASYPEFDDISVFKDYPDRLVIRVSKATPVVQLKTIGGAYMLDRGGRILEKRYDPVTATHLPVIQTTTPLYIGKMKLGSTVPVDGIQTAVQTVLAMRKVGISIDAVAIQNPTMIVLNSEAMQLVVSDEKELQQQLWELTEVVSRSRKKGVTLASVDVRFSKPVITLAR